MGGREKLDQTCEKNRGRHLVKSRFYPRFVIYYTFSASPSTTPDTSVGAAGAFRWVRLSAAVHDCHARQRHLPSILRSLRAGDTSRYRLIGGDGGGGGGGDRASLLYMYTVHAHV